MTITKRIRPNFWSASIYDKNDYLARPRVFVDSDVQEDRADSLPTSVLRKGTQSIMNKLRLPFGDFEMKFSKSAGCRICPCSPGFILQVAGYSKHNEASINLRFELPNGKMVDFPRYDVYVTLKQTATATPRRVAASL